MTQKYAVFGNPIEHSKSPPIHQQFARQFDLDIDYRKILSTPEAFADDIHRFFADDGVGCNVTVPFKEQAFALCDALTATAKTAGAVNTLYKEADKLWGHNSDGAGLVNDLSKNHGVAIENARILILGAGGATRGILEPLITNQPTSITVANRTITKANKLAGEFASMFPVKSTGNDLSDFSGAADLIINATSASLSAQVPINNADVIATHTICYDLAYAFHTWTNQQPDTAPVINWLANA